MKGKTKISIIIRTRNEGDALFELLKRISKQKTYNQLKYEIIIVDSDSTDNTRSIAESYGCYVVNIKKEEFSWGKAINLGIKEAKGDFCVLISSHCFPANDSWLYNLIKPLLLDEKIAATYGRQIPIKGVNPFEEVELKTWFPINVKRYSSSIIGISNANACIRKSVWKLVNFDEYLSSSEDIDWALKVMDLGFKISYVPEAIVYHSHVMALENVYRRWYWRIRTNVYVFRHKDKRISFARNILIPQIIALFYSILQFLKWNIKDIKYFAINYLKELWKIPIYEFIKAHAIYEGLKDGLIDLKNNNTSNKFNYFENNIPKLIKYMKFIEINKRNILSLLKPMEYE